MELTDTPTFWIIDNGEEWGPFTEAELAEMGPCETRPVIDWPEDAEDYGGCECELDWNCGRHGYTETPEDRMATAWRSDQWGAEGPEMPF